MPHDERPTRREHCFWIGSMIAFGVGGAYVHEPIWVLGASLGLFLWLVSIPVQKGSHS